MLRRGRRQLPALLLCLLAACSEAPDGGGGGDAAVAAAERSAPPVEASPTPRAVEPSAVDRAAADASPTAAAPATGAPVVVFLGDSLTAGLGLGAEQAFPALVAAELAERGLPIRAVNAGVSGDTSAGGLRRVDWLLRQHPDVVVVALGANDALRGQPVAGIEANLREIVTRARAAGARVLLVGIQVPPSYGDDYARAFAAVYPRLAGELGVPLLPFLLEGVGGDPDLNLADGIHPNEEGHRRVAALVTSHLEPLVRAAEEPAAAAR